MSSHEQVLKLARLINRAHRAFQRLMQPIMEEKGFNLSLTEMMVMRLVSEEQSVRVSHLSEKLGVPPSTMTSILDRLEDKNIVRRVRSREDRRAIAVELVPDMEERKREMYQLLAEELTEALKEISPERVSQMVADMEYFLEKLMNQQKGDRDGRE
ncbi:MAG: MarR family transcriptional regulator [Thermoanaerobacteraceae bacterium]|nr:MarR family transcriptional regulator [Thermoanaerobacteraceae bacterium]